MESLGRVKILDPKPITTRTILLTWKKVEIWVDFTRRNTWSAPNLTFSWTNLARRISFRACTPPHQTTFKKKTKSKSKRRLARVMMIFRRRQAQTTKRDNFQIKESTVRKLCFSWAKMFRPNLATQKATNSTLKRITQLAQTISQIQTKISRIIEGSRVKGADRGLNLVKVIRERPFITPQKWMEASQTLAGVLRIMVGKGSRWARVRTDSRRKNLGVQIKFRKKLGRMRKLLTQKVEVKVS